MALNFTKKQVFREDNPKNHKEAIKTIADDINVDANEGERLIQAFVKLLSMAILDKRKIKITSIGVFRKKTNQKKAEKVFHLKKKPKTVSVKL